MATVKKLGKNKYEVRYDQYDRDGKRHQKRKTFDRAGDANAFVASLDSSTPYEASYLRFSDWIEQWFTDYSPRIESTTVSAYRRIVDRWKAFFGEKKLSAVTPSDIERFCTLAMQPDNGISSAPMSASTVQRHRAVLHRAFHYAVRDGLLPSNPLDRVDPPKIIHKEIELPDIAETQRRIDGLKGTPLYLPVCIALLTGMRRSEIMGLMWDCVDLKQATIAVRRVRQRLTKKELETMTMNAHTRPVTVPGSENNIIRDCTKSKHDRVISIPQSLVALLRQARAQQAANRLRLADLYVPSDYVCVYDDGHLISDNALSKSLNGFCRLHDLRHLSASLLLDAGYSVASVADRMGHTTPATTLKVYAHAMQNRDKYAADEIDRHFDIKT